MSALLPVTPAGCAHCGSPSAIRGEGEVRLTCRPCVASLGRVVAEPYSVSAVFRERLLARSLDVVDLVGPAWRWTGAWPGVER